MTKGEPGFFLSRVLERTLATLAQSAGQLYA
jgi:hypothetical protein